MSALSIIISREFKERVHKKSFIVTTILAPILMVALMALPALISYFSTPGLRKIAVIDHSGIVLPDLLKSAQDVEYLTFVPTDESLDKALANENYQDVLVIGADIDENPSNVKLYNHETGSVEIENQINHVVEKSVSTYRMTRYNIPNIDQILADSKVECSLQTIRVSDDGEEEDTSTMISTLLGISMTFILYMFLLMYGQMVMSSIIEEKGNRVLELVVTSVKPTQLMMGKIIGVGLVAVLQIAIWAVFVTLASSVLMPMLISDSVASQISMYNAGTLDMTGTDNVEMIQALSMFTSVGKILMLFVYMTIFLVGGFLFYAAMFAAIGSSVDNVQDSSQLATFVTIPIILGIVMAMSVGTDPNSTMALWTSMIPFTSPMVMMARIPFGIPDWQIWVSALILFLSFGIMAWFAGKIYRIGIFMYGKKPTIKDLIRWARYK